MNKQRLSHFILLGMPIVVVYGLGFFIHPFNTAWGDSDFFFAMYEAMRKSILEYGQFPWWNPWVAGGIPLYADPQFGLISLQTLFILPFGTVIGWKFALIAYLLIGFYGFRKLFIDFFKTPPLTATLLSLTWAFMWLWAARSSGHYTFFVLAYLPWILIFYLRRDSIKHAWLWLGLLIGLCINTAIHNMTVMSLLLFFIFIIIDIIATLRKRDGARRLKQLALFLCASTLTALVISAHKIYFTLQYASDFSKDPSAMPPELFTGFKATFNALFGIIPQNVPVTLPTGWSGAEAWVGLGIGVFAALLFITYKTIRSKASLIAQFSFNPFVLVILCILFLLLSFGDFTQLAPYSILRELPVFNQTRVSVRWLIFAGIVVLFLVAAYRQKDRVTTRVINLMLAAGVIQLVVTIYPIINTHYNRSAPYENIFKNDSTPYQYADWITPRHSGKQDVTLFGGVINNVDQISTNLTPYFDTTKGNTARCDERKKGCTYVLTKNAKVTSWTPNRLILERTGPGTIRLNSNPSSKWLVNGNYIFADIKTTDTFTPFSIHDTSDVITIEYAPAGSIVWIKHKL